ncbi:MAG: hypothetical protein NWF10_08060 [Candidatus Bathyarchaeota archaeon]|nr:hypothetical protein [Candidatus Bathyarchaeota archaeon]
MGNPFKILLIFSRDMSLIKAIAGTLKSKRFWLWQVSGAMIYSVPVAIRFFSGTVMIPLLNFPGFWIGHFIPGNFLEKLLINAFFPGGAGGVTGEIFVSKYKSQLISGKTKYQARLGGALLQTAIWAFFQYWGYSLLILGPWSSGTTGGNIFEHAVVFPINFFLASISIFTPDILNFIKFWIKKKFNKQQN